MKYQIVTDSASDLKNDYISDNEIGFNVVSLSINIGEKDYKDDANIDVEKMLESMNEYSGKSSTSCPSPGDFYDAFMQSEITYCVTISSQMSGSYNSALVAKKMAEENGKKVFVLDSKSVAGAQILIVDKLYSLIKSGKSFDEVCKSIENYNSERSLLFMLDKFDNLIKNGRMGKLAGAITAMFSIKPIMAASKEGSINLIEKVIGAKKAVRSLIEKIISKISNESTIVITHCHALRLAETIKEEILEKYNNVKVKIVETRGLTSFYAEEGGVLVSF